MRVLFSIYFWAVFSVITIAFAIFIIAVSPVASDRFLFKIGKLWGKTVLKISFTKVDYKELSDFPKDEIYIIMPNHQSAFDIFTLYSCLPVPFVWVSKSSNFRIPFLGWAMKAMRYISVDRDNVKSVKKTIKELIETVERGMSVVIFPEGTRSHTGELLPFKKGGFFLASKTSKKILPVAIWGSKDVLKRGEILLSPFKKIKVLVGDPISFPKNTSIPEKMKVVKKELENLIRQIS